MTAPPAVIRQLFKHPLTDKRHRGLPQGLEATGQKIG
jgi:transaldolase